MACQGQGTRKRKFSRQKKISGTVIFHLFDPEIVHLQFCMTIGQPLSGEREAKKTKRRG